MLFLAAGLGGLRTAALPKPLAVATVVLGVLSLLRPTGVAVYLLTPVWLIGTGIVLHRRLTSGPSPTVAATHGAQVNSAL